MRRKKIRKGNYDVGLQVRRKDEIGQLADSFSIMVKELEKSEAARQEFVANVSHELQSPLTSMKGFATLLRSETLTKDERAKYLEIMADETARLSTLTKQLLTLASLDQEVDLLKQETFDLKGQWKQLLQMTEWSWREKRLTIDIDLADISYKGDAELLYQAWSNLLVNAIKYTPPEGKITIRLTENETDIIVKVADNGIGIQAADLPEIFTRFYKTDQTRPRVEGSSGLGLSITKKIIDLHHGTITVESELEKGTIFTIRLPKN